VVLTIKAFEHVEQIFGDFVPLLLNEFLCSSRPPIFQAKDWVV